MLSKEKSTFSQMINSHKPFWGGFYSVHIFGPFFTFRPNAKTSVSPYFGPGPAPFSFWVIFLTTGTILPSFVDLVPKLEVLSLFGRPRPKNDQNQARRPENGPPNGKTRVTSGYWELIIPLGRIPKNKGFYMGVA